MKLYLILCMSLLYGYVYAQNNSGGQENPKSPYRENTELQFDLLGDSANFPGDFQIRNDARLRYKINNINRNVYTVTLNSVASTLFMDKHPIFNLVSDIDLSKLPKGEPSATKATSQGHSNFDSFLYERKIPNALTTGYLNAKKTLTDHILYFEKNYSNLKKVNTFYRQVVSLLNDGITDFESINDTKLESASALLSTVLGYEIVGKEEKSILDSLRHSVDELFVDLAFTYASILRGQIQLKKQFEIFELDALQIIKQNTESLSKAKRSERDNRREIITDTRSKIASEKMAMESIESIIDEIKVARIKVVEMEEKAFVETLLTTFKKINRDNWTYLSAPIKAEKDLVGIKLAITPKEASLHSSNYNRFNGDYKGHVYGFKINFSSGIFILSGKNLQDHSYRVDTIAGDPSNNNIVENENKQKLQPAFGALMHFYFKRPADVSVGGAFGLSVSAGTRLNYHGGLSLLIGQEQRLILSGGATLAQVKEISNSYHVGQLISKSKVLDPVPTETFYRWGHFLSLTYNLLK